MSELVVHRPADEVAQEARKARGQSHSAQGAGREDADATSVLRGVHGAAPGDRRGGPREEASGVAHVEALFHAEHEALQRKMVRKDCNSNLSCLRRDQKRERDEHARAPAAKDEELRTARDAEKRSLNARVAELAGKLKKAEAALEAARGTIRKQMERVEKRDEQMGELMSAHQAELDDAKRSTEILSCRRRKQTTLHRAEDLGGEMLDERTPSIVVRH